MANIIENLWKSGLRVTETTFTAGKTGLDLLFGKPAPSALREAFENLGTTYIKLGQFIASAPSLFPADYVQEFQKCLDQTTPLPFSKIEEILQDEWAADPYKKVKSIDPVPLASASIAQVHSGLLTDGREIVLKVQKPGVKDVILTDLNFLYTGSRILEWLNPAFARTSLTGIIEDIQKTMMEECDFILEAAHMKAFNEFLTQAELDHSTVPHVYDHLTTTKILCMERFHGVPLTDLESIQKYSKNPEQTLIYALNTWFTSLVFCDFFHADVHAGNLMVREDGRIGFIDFGIVGRISKDTWQAIFDFFQSVQEEDHVQMADALIRIGFVDIEVDRIAFASDLKRIFKQFESLENNMAFQTGFNPDMAEMEINNLMIDLATSADKHGIRFPREFTLLIKQFLYFDRYIKILAPELNMFADERINRLPSDIKVPRIN